MRNTLITLLFSVIKAAIVSSLFAGLAYLTNHSALLWFVVTLVAQFVVFYLYGVYIDYIAARDNRALALKELEILSRITFIVPCAACRVENEVVVNPSDDTKFICNNCKIENAVYVNIESAVVTNPIGTKTPNI